MKLLAVIFPLLFSLSSFAYLNEVECELEQENRFIKVEIERPFPRNAMTKVARISVIEDRRERVYHSDVMTYRSRGFNIVRYEGRGLQLEIDYGPFSRPDPWREYNGRLISYHLGNRYISNLDCRFPFAN